MTTQTLYELADEISAASYKPWPDWFATGWRMKCWIVHRKRAAWLLVAWLVCLIFVFILGGAVL